LHRFEFIAYSMNI